MKHRPTRAFLVTVTPGRELAQAFGHAAIAFDEGELVAYSYGGYVLPPIRPNLGTSDLWEMVGATTFETLLPVINRTLRASKVREPLAQFKQHGGPHQRLLVDELILTTEQRERLYRRVSEDFARLEPGEKTAGVYRYDHFANNCVTRLRDELFGALGEINMLYQRGDIDQSFEQIIEESLADAIEASPLGLQLFPRGLEQGLNALLPGIPAASRAPGDFLAATRCTLEGLSSTSAFSSEKGRQALATALNLLNVEIPKRPRSFRESLFTPRRLREALVNWPNSSTGRALLAPGPTEGDQAPPLV